MKKLAIIAYLGVGFGVAVQSPPMDRVPYIGHAAKFVIVTIAWPVSLGALISEQRELNHNIRSVLKAVADD